MLESARQYLGQKRGEWLCWARRLGWGHRWVLLGGADYAVVECERCGAYRVGSLDFFNPRHHTLEETDRA